MTTLSGHVRKRGSNTWQIIIEQPPCPDTGKRNRVYATVSGTRKESERVMREMMAELETNSYIKNTAITVGAYFMDWFGTYIEPHKAKTTAASYLYNIEYYIIPRFGSMKLQSLTTLDIQKWINELAIKSPLSNRPLSPKSIRNLYMNLNAGLKRAVLLELIRKNPGATVELPKCKPYKAEVYNAEELQQLFEAAQGTDLEIGIMLLVCLGIRRGELMALTWPDIDFDNKLVNINKATVKVHSGGKVTKDPKSESGKRVIEAPDVLIDFLRRERVTYLERKLQHGAEYHDNGLVVCQSNGKSYSVDFYTHKFKALLKAHGLKKIRLHDLRHSHASFCILNGVDYKYLQGRLGHSAFSTTMDTYSHILSDHAKNEAEKVNTGLQSIVAKVH